MKKKRNEREAYLDNVMDEINSQLNEVEIDADVYGRPKHLYKYLPQNGASKKQFNEIYDLLAVRIP